MRLSLKRQLQYWLIQWNHISEWIFSLKIDLVYIQSLETFWVNLFIAKFKVYGENVDFYLQGIASLKYVKSKTKKTEKNILKVSQ